MTARVVTSLANETVKAVRGLHLRKAREESGLFLAEGLKIVAEAVDLGFAPRVLLYGPEASDHPILRRVAAAAAEVLEVTPAILAKISRRENPQMVLGVFEQRFTPLSDLDPATARCWVGLEAVRDPGNLGTIIRTADGAGCGGRDPHRRLLRPLFGGGGARHHGLDLRRAHRAGERAGIFELAGNVAGLGGRDAAQCHARFSRARLP